MSFLKRLRGKTAEPTVLEQLEAAVDEVNRLTALLPPEDGRIRPWVRAASRTTRTGPKLMLGYWDAGSDRFIVTYGE